MKQEYKFQSVFQLRNETNKHSVRNILSGHYAVVQVKFRYKKYFLFSKSCWKTKIFSSLQSLSISQTLKLLIYEKENEKKNNNNKNWGKTSVLPLLTCHLKPFARDTQKSPLTSRHKITKFLISIELLPHTETYL